MTRKMDEAALRRKNRSLETMLTRERSYSRDMETITEAAVKALEETNNGQIKEAVGTILEAVEGIEARRKGNDADAAAIAAGLGGEAGTKA